MFTPLAGQRGPAEHERREQILGAASEHFRHYGYNKTTVADVAKAIGLSTAYIYKFFELQESDRRSRLQHAAAQDRGRADRHRG